MRFEQLNSPSTCLALAADIAFKKCRMDNSLIFETPGLLRMCHYDRQSLNLLERWHKFQEPNEHCGCTLCDCNSITITGLTLVGEPAHACKGGLFYITNEGVSESQNVQYSGYWDRKNDGPEATSPYPGHGASTSCIYPRAPFSITNARGFCTGCPY